VRLPAGARSPRASKAIRGCWMGMARSNIVNVSAAGLLGNADVAHHVGSASMFQHLKVRPSVRILRICCTAG